MDRFWSPRGVGLAAALGLLGLGITLWGWRRYRTAARKSLPEPTLSRVIGRVSHLVIYPIKSCKGIPMDSARYDRFGFLGDRRWMVVDEKNTFLSQRRIPKMAIVEPTITATHLEVNAPGMPTLRVPLDKDEEKEIEVRLWGKTFPASHEGDEAAEWFSKCLGTTVSLVRMPKKHDRQIEEDFRVAGASNNASFADDFAFLLASESSLEDLNKRMEKPLPMARFRPNIVVKLDPPYNVPWVEDQWYKIKLANDQFYVVKPSSRCKMPTVDQDKGEFDGEEPTKTMKTFRQGKNNELFFAQNLVQAVDSGSVAVGDPVIVLEGRRNDFLL